MTRQSDLQPWQFLLGAFAALALAGQARRLQQAVRVGAGAAKSLPGTRQREILSVDSHSDDMSPAAVRETGRGRLADRPSEIPKPGWRDVLLRVKRQIGEDNVSLTASGVAYGWLLAVFPLLGSLIAIYGVVADAAEVQRQVEGLFGLLSPQIVDMLHDQLTKLTQASETALGFGALFGILFSLWSANSGTKSMIVALNIVYSEKEKRGFFKLNLVSLSLTIGLVLAAIAALWLMVGLPILFRIIGKEDIVRGILDIGRWPVLAVAFMLGLSVLYRQGPSREKPLWRWVTWGSALATLLWVAASGLFAVYVANFGKYDETYGSLGAVVILMMWFYMTAFIILLGAELNAELEHQTARDSTIHKSRPMGRRGAHMADTLGARQ